MNATNRPTTTAMGLTKHLVFARAHLLLAGTAFQEMEQAGDEISVSDLEQVTAISRHIETLHALSIAHLMRLVLETPDSPQSRSSHPTDTSSADTPHA